ncbi:hypothetical protein GCM10009541_37680 [Micromonospora gifhornensis]|uniref:Beta-lactamase inhibitor (BLIP) n=1 Tax=Micromonospora gifhornensis TaxID=84594 RepID=A0ABQ4IK80_9ACTN|nr:MULTISPECIES: hypothetical protein [Micromonospora]PMR62274.1 hypothetical protein C1A38_04615 [Verrucosispora sp. ts21]GIJ18313.1 hypothetical protein Vgi01_49970 [Micromonospora gifhornensis]
MRKTAKRIAAVLAAAALTTTLAAAPAAAKEVEREPFKVPDQGLVLYTANSAYVVARHTAVDDLCHPMQDAVTSIAWTPVYAVAYASDDCTGYGLGLGIWRGWSPGQFQSYKLTSY